MVVIYFAIGLGAADLAGRWASGPVAPVGPVSPFGPAGPIGPKDWTQEDLSARSGLAVVQVSRIERGVREIRLTTLLQLVQALDVEPNELLRDVSLPS